jgi:hypothetical protein
VLFIGSLPSVQAQVGDIKPDRIPTQQSYRSKTIERRSSESASDAGNANRSSAAEVRASDSPKQIVALSVWVVTLSDVNVALDKDAKAQSGEDASSVPMEFRTWKEVRDLIARFKAAKRVRASRELRMMTVDGQSARLQCGIDHPQVTSTSVSNRGRQNALMYRQIGTVVDARPVVDTENRIQVQLDYNMSDSAKSNDVAVTEDADGKTQFADVMITRQVKTTVRLKNDTASLVQFDETSGTANRSGEAQIELIILGVSLLPAAESIESASENPPTN